MKRVCRCAVLSLISLCVLLTGAFAQERRNDTVALSKQALEASSAAEMYTALSALEEVYLDEQRYSDFVEFMKSLLAKKKAYGYVTENFIAAVRYAQLIHLEDAQQWDEYFSMGNTYREEITEGASKAIAAAPVQDAVAVYARIVLWEFHNHQQDAFLQQARDELIKESEVYASFADTQGEPLKSAADSLLMAGERARAKQIYRLYVDKVTAQGLSMEKIKELADAFLADGNMDLAQSLYDLYIDDLIAGVDAQAAAALLMEIAGEFTPPSQAADRARRAYDMAYAEQLYQQAEELVGRAAFPQERLYQRARSLQAAGEYAAAQEIFSDILALYPSSAYGPEARYKAGVLAGYALRDKEQARLHLSALAEEKEAPDNVYRLASLYELGLLSQWEGNLEPARSFYQQYLEAVDESQYLQTVALIRQRLQEIESGSPLEYNLKTFLDLTFLEENSRFNMTRVTLSRDPGIIAAGEQTEITALPVLGPTGCFQVDVQYMWSGNLGNASVRANEGQFVTAFAQQGPQSVCVVVNSPAGFVDRNFLLIDVE